MSSPTQEDYDCLLAGQYKYARQITESGWIGYAETVKPKRHYLSYDNGKPSDMYIVRPDGLIPGSREAIEHMRQLAAQEKELF